MATSPNVGCFLRLVDFVSVMRRMSSSTGIITHGFFFCSLDLPNISIEFCIRVSGTCFPTFVGRAGGI